MGIATTEDMNVSPTIQRARRVCILTRGDLFPTNHGAAVKIVRTAEALSRMGAPCTVVTDDRDRYWRFVDGEAQAVPYPTRFRAVQEWPPLPRLGHLAERICGALGYPSEEYFLYRPQFDPSWWLRAVAVGVLEDVEVFQAEFPGYGVPAFLAARLVGQQRPDGHRPRSCVVQHNVEWDRLQEFGHEVSRIRSLEQWVLGQVDEVIAVSEDDRRRMVAAGLCAEKVTVIPHGVDVHRFQSGCGDGIRERYGIEQDVPLLFFHGTLHYWPNTEAVRFIAERLLPRVLKAYPTARVLIAGQGAPTYYSHPAIVFTGAADDLENLIAAADLCLCPIEAGGGTRLKLLEYMAAGKPTISTTKGAEGIEYRSGVQLEIADGTEAFSQGVIDLLANPARRDELGRAAAAFGARYDWSEIGSAYLDLYAGEGRGQIWAPRPDVGAHLPVGRAPSKPLTMLLLINRGCNLRCVFCDLWEDFENMPLAKILPLLDQAVEIGTRTLVITGGEPLIHPDIWTVVAAAKSRGLSVNITTNGTLINKHWDALTQSGVDSLSFSLDGMPATHDEVRGQKGAWKRTVEALDRVRLHTDLATSVYFVVTNKNVSELPLVYDMVRSKGAHFDFWPVNDAEDLYLKTDEDKALWRAALQHIGAQEPDVRARQSYYEEGLVYHQGVTGPVRCLGLVDQYGVTYDGRLLPCCVWGGDGLTVGNVFERPLTELWTDPEVQVFREKMYRDGCTAGCYNHSLYEFATSTGEPFGVEAK